jgi:hypothetical protein
LTAVVVAVRSFFRAGDVRAPPPRLAGGGFPPRPLLVAAGTGAAPAPGSFSSATSDGFGFGFGFGFGDAAGDRDQTTFTSNDCRRFAVRGNVSAFFALSITALAALGDKHRTSVFASDTVGMDCRDAGGGDGDGDGDGDLAFFLAPPPFAACFLARPLRLGPLGSGFASSSSAFPTFANASIPVASFTPPAPSSLYANDTREFIGHS